MLWLLKAEFRKLVRPLVWGTALRIVAFCLLITWGAANNARGGLASPRIPDVCATAATTQCRQVIAHAHAAARAAAAATGQLSQPGQIGHVAAGMLASLPGLLLIAHDRRWALGWRMGITDHTAAAEPGGPPRPGTRREVAIHLGAGVATLLACWLVLARRHR